MKRVAVILSGSGYLDGSEIREAVGTLWALSTVGAEARCFALDAPQADVVNTLTGKPLSENRNQLIESARIARGQVRPLTELRSQEFHAVILPGGYGAAKNLSTFASKGSGGEVQPEVARVLKEFQGAGKPIGAICIAPAVVALTFRNGGFQLTVGESCEPSQEIEKLGHTHVVKGPAEWLVDRKQKVVTTPAYMYDDAPLKDIFQGIQGLVKEVVALT